MPVQGVAVDRNRVDPDTSNSRCIVQEEQYVPNTGRMQQCDVI